MRGKFQVIDCNRHVMEPTNLWNVWLEEPFKGAGAVRVEEDRATIVVKGRPVTMPRPNFLANALYQKTFKDAVIASFSAQSNLQDMDREGVDVAVLLPTVGLYAIWANHIDAALAAAMCRAYNNWMHGYCQADPKRLKAVALLPLQDVGEAAKELQRAVRQLGCVAGFMRPNPIVGRKLHDAAYDPLYGKAQELGVPIVLCEAGGTVLPQMGVDRYDSHYAREAVVDTFEMWLALMSFMGNNVLERFPDLKVGFLGAGCGWLPFWLDRVNGHWGGPFGSDAPSTMPPRYLFKTQGFAAADPWERILPQILEEAGDRAVVWGSQYPLPESAMSFPRELDAIVNEPLLSDDQKKMILWENAATLFRV